MPPNGEKVPNKRGEFRKDKNNDTYKGISEYDGGVVFDFHLEKRGF